MSRTLTPEHEAWLAANRFVLVSEKHGHWARNIPKRVMDGHKDLTHTVAGKWFAMFFEWDATGACWEGPEFDEPEVAWVHAELNNWGQP